MIFLFLGLFGSGDPIRMTLPFWLIGRLADGPLFISGLKATHLVGSLRISLGVSHWSSGSRARVGLQASRPHLGDGLKRPYLPRDAQCCLTRRETPERLTVFSKPAGSSWCFCAVAEQLGTGRVAAGRASCGRDRRVTSARDVGVVQKGCTVVQRSYDWARQGRVELSSRFVCVMRFRTEAEAK